MKKENRITVEIETFEHGTFLASGYTDMAHFESNTFFHQGYFISNDGTIVNAKLIKIARVKEEYEVELK